MSPLSLEDPRLVYKPRPESKIHCLAFVLDSSEEIQPATMAQLKSVQMISIQKGYFKLDFAFSVYTVCVARNHYLNYTFILILVKFLTPLPRFLVLVLKTSWSSISHTLQNYTFCFLGIPQLIILTKIDICDETTEKNVASLFQSKPIGDVVTNISKSFGIPQNLVYPVKNYTKELTLDTGVDILALLALRQMLFCAEDHIDNAQMRGAMSAMAVGGGDHENASESA